MDSFDDPLANFVLGITFNGDKIRRRKTTRLESYSRTSYARIVSRLQGATVRNYAAAVRSLIADGAHGLALELTGPAPDVAQIARDIDIPALEEAVEAEIQLSLTGIRFIPAAARWTPRLALWLACDLVDRNRESLHLNLAPDGRKEALRLLQREVSIDANYMDWLQAMTPDWKVWAEVVGFEIVGTRAAIAPYRAEVELGSEIISDVCDVLVAQGDRRTYACAWQPDARHRVSQMKEYLLRLAFSECEISLHHVLTADTIACVSALEKECKGKPYPHQFFAEVEPHRTLSRFFVWHVSAENDPNFLAGTISRLFESLRIGNFTRPGDFGGNLLYYTPDGNLLARLAIAPEGALKAASKHYKNLIIAEIFPQPILDQEE